jgi:hypothetical protein
VSVVVAASASSSVSSQGGGLLRRELFYDIGWRMCRIYRPHARAAITGHIDRSVGAVGDAKGAPATVWTDGRTHGAGHGIDASKDVSGWPFNKYLVCFSIQAEGLLQR